MSSARIPVAQRVEPNVTVGQLREVGLFGALSDEFLDHLLATAHDSTGRAVYTEREAALSLAHYSLVALGRTDDEADYLVDSMRATNYTSTYRPA